MSTPLSQPAVLDPMTAFPDGDPSRRFRVWATVILGTLGSALLAVSSIVKPDIHGSDADVVPKLTAAADQVLAGQLVAAFGSLLLVLFVVGTWRLDTRKGSILRLVGGTIATLGLVSNALGEIADGYAAWGSAQGHVSTATEIRMLDSLDSLPAGLPIAWFAVPVAVTGVLILAIGVLRASAVVPVWAPVVVILGAVLSAVFTSGPLSLLGLVTAVGVGATLVYIARAIRS
jgi:hypothetical protein